MFGFNAAQMRRIMKDMSVQEIEAKRAIIETSDGKITIENPKVTSMQIQGQKTYTILVLGKELFEKNSGKAEGSEVSEEDIALVQEKTGASKQEAIEALRKSNNDLALAIKILKEK